MNSDIFTMNYQQKLAAARNPNTPQEILKLLASDEDSYVRHWVAKNPNTPQETLKILASDKNYYVRSRVAENPNRNQIIERLVLMTNYQTEMVR